MSAFFTASRNLRTGLMHEAPAVLENSHSDFAGIFTPPLARRVALENTPWYSCEGLRRRNTTFCPGKSRVSRESLSRCVIKIGSLSHLEDREILSYSIIIQSTTSIPSGNIVSRVCSNGVKSTNIIILSSWLIMNKFH